MRPVEEPKRRTPWQRAWSKGRWPALALLAAALMGAIGVGGLSLASIGRERLAPRLGAPAGTKWADALGAKVALREPAEQGEGPLALFVHGTGAWGGLWDAPSAQAAAMGARSVAVDLPPFGWSGPAPRGDYSDKAQGARLNALARELGGGRKAILIAHSRGAGPALEAALAEPALWARLVLVDPAFGLPAPGEDPKPGPTLSERAARAILSSPAGRRALLGSTATNPALTRHALAAMMWRKEAATEREARILREPLAKRGATEELGKWALAALLPEGPLLGDEPERLRALAVPVSLAWGIEDSVTPIAQAKEIMARVPQARLRAIDAAGHIPHLEAPGAFCEALRDALEADLPKAKGFGC